MTDEQRLLYAVLLDPADDLPRLVYADYLEGDARPPQPDRAESIRVQCELAGLERERADLLNDETDWSLCETESGVSAVWCPNCGDCRCPDREDRMDDPACPLHAPDSKHCWGSHLDRKADALRRREAELWRTVSQQVIPSELHCRVFGNDAVAGRPCEVRNANAALVVRRGFVAEVRAPLASLFGGECGECRTAFGRATGTVITRGPTLSTCPACSGTGRTPGAAPNIFGSQPVTSVVVTDREPAPTHYGESDPPHRFWVKRLPGWTMEDHEHHLPPELFDRLEGGEPRQELQVASKWYPTRELALSALSAAAVAYGRSVAAGWTHRVACQICEGQGWFWTPAGGGLQNWNLCHDCSGTGTRTLPGLPPPPEMSHGAH